MRLKDKSIIITGASSGIGKSTALLCAKEGANLILGSRRKALLDELAAEIRDSGGSAVAVAGDVQEEAYSIELVDAANSTFGGLDGVLNNAGMLGDMVSIPEMSAESWNAVIATNLSSAFFAAKYQIPAIKSRGGGSVVFTSSFVGYTIGLPGMGAYAASKAGLIGLTQVLAAEHGDQGVRVNALLPGGTKTPMAGDDPQFHALVAKMHALKRMAEPEEIAAAALFLLSSESSFITGSAFFVDGGNSIQKM